MAQPKSRGAQQFNLLTERCSTVASATGTPPMYWNARSCWLSSPARSASCSPRSCPSCITHPAALPALTGKGSLQARAFLQDPHHACDRLFSLIGSALSSAEGVVSELRQRRSRSLRLDDDRHPELLGHRRPDVRLYLLDGATRGCCVAPQAREPTRSRGPRCGDRGSRSWRPVRRRARSRHG